MEKASKTPHDMQQTMWARLEDLDFAHIISQQSQKDTRWNVSKIEYQLIDYAGQVGLKIHSKNQAHVD